MVMFLCNRIGGVVLVMCLRQEQSRSRRAEMWEKWIG